MSHIISGRLDGETAPADAAEKYEDVLEAFRPILGDEDFDEIPERWDGEVPAYVEFSVRFDHRDDVDAIVAELEDAFGGAEWRAIHTRTDEVKATLAEYRDDPEYFDPDLENGVRVPVLISRPGRFEPDVGPPQGGHCKQ